MSAEATGWVLKHSPYKGAPFAVHFCIADSVNDQYRNEFWMRQHILAQKARISRQATNQAVQQLVDDGFLLLVGSTEPHTGKPRRYRFLMPDTDVQYDPVGVVNRDDNPSDGRSWVVISGDRGVNEDDNWLSTQTTGVVNTDDTEPNRTQELSQEDPAGISDLAFGDDDFPLSPSGTA